MFFLFSITVTFYLVITSAGSSPLNYRSRMHLVSSDVASISGSFSAELYQRFESTGLSEGCFVSSYLPLALHLTHTEDVFAEMSWHDQNLR